MAEQFPKPELPRVDNVVGHPTPPSGEHTPVDSSATIVQVGSLPHPPPSSEPAKNDGHA
jgi:hypothetical protein